VNPLDEITPAMHARIRERIHAHIDVQEGDKPYETGCWVWTGMKDPDGYPRIKIGRRQHRTHRVALVVFAKPNDPKPAPGAQANHRCHNRLCVKPGHLYWGSHAQNMDDLRQSGRSQGKYNHGRVTITEDVVKAALVLHEHGGFSKTKIGNLLGYRQQLIGEIVRGKHFSTRKE
jgi:hypothetical protein